MISPSQQAAERWKAGLGAAPPPSHLSAGGSVGSRELCPRLQCPSLGVFCSQLRGGSVSSQGVSALIPFWEGWSISLLAGLENPPVPHLQLFTALCRRGTTSSFS